MQDGHGLFLAAVRWWSSVEQVTRARLVFACSFGLMVVAVCLVFLARVWQPSHYDGVERDNAVTGAAAGNSNNCIQSVNGRHGGAKSCSDGSGNTDSTTVPRNYSSANIGNDKSSKPRASNLMLYQWAWAAGALSLEMLLLLLHRSSATAILVTSSLLSRCAARLSLWFNSPARGEAHQQHPVEVLLTQWVIAHCVFFGEKYGGVLRKVRVSEAPHATNSVIFYHSLAAHPSYNCSARELSFDSNSRHQWRVHRPHGVQPNHRGCSHRPYHFLWVSSVQSSEALELLYVVRSNSCTPTNIWQPITWDHERCPRVAPQLSWRFCSIRASDNKNK